MTILLGGEMKKMKTKITNLFTAEEINIIRDAISELSESQFEVHETGRKQTNQARLPGEFSDKLVSLVRDITGVTTPLRMLEPPQYVEYGSEYGTPWLQPHVDGDFNDFIIDYQLEANTEWPLGADTEVYPLEDNEGLLFNPNMTIHWRPRKTFKPGEYVRMLFFRFHNPENYSDYSHLPHNPNDPMFKDVHEFRDSLTPNEEI